MFLQPKPYITPEQYLDIERAAEYRSEYFDGEMFAMSGGMLNHATVTDNPTVLIGGQSTWRLMGPPDRCTLHHRS